MFIKKICSRVSAGVGGRVDLDQASGRMTLAESNRLTETSDLHQVSARYQRLTGEVPGTVLELSPSLGQFISARARLLSDAIANNPELLGAISTIRAYRTDADVRLASN